MQKKIISLSLAIVIFFSFLNAQVVTTSPTTDTLLSTQIQQLTAILAQEHLGNKTFVTEYMPRVLQTVQTLNVIADGTRKVRAMYEQAKDYTAKQLLKDAAEGLCEAFIEACPEAKEAFGELYDNVEMIAKRDKDFWYYSSAWDSETDEFITSMVDGTMKAYVYPKVAPNVSKFYGFDKGPQNVQAIFEASMMDSGLSKLRNFEAYQASLINMQLKKFLDDADKSKNIVAQGQAIEMGIQQGMARDTADMKHIMMNKHLKDAMNNWKAADELLTYESLYKSYQDAMLEAGTVDEALK